MFIFLLHFCLPYLSPGARSLISALQSNSKTYAQSLVAICISTTLGTHYTELFDNVNVCTDGDRHMLPTARCYLQVNISITIMSPHTSASYCILWASVCTDVYVCLQMHVWPFHTLKSDLHHGKITENKMNNVWRRESNSGIEREKIKGR